MRCDGLGDLSVRRSPILRLELEFRFRPNLNGAESACVPLFGRQFACPASLWFSPPLRRRHAGFDSPAPGTPAELVQTTTDARWRNEIRAPSPFCEPAPCAWMVSFFRPTARFHKRAPRPLAYSPWHGRSLGALRGLQRAEPCSSQLRWPAAENEHRVCHCVRVRFLREQTCLPLSTATSHCEGLSWPLSW